MRNRSRPGACSATVKAPLRMAVPSRWISHDLPTTRRSPCAERASGRSPPTRQTPTCGGVFRQQFRSGVAEAALIEDEEVEAGEVRCDQGELLAQRSLRQAQRSADGEPVRLDVEEHERAVVATTGEIEAGDDQAPAAAPT